MIEFVIKRLLMMVPVLIGLTIAVFIVTRIIPGDVASVMLEDSIASPEQRAAIMDDLGLADPLYVQYIKWAGGVMQGDLGTSFWTKRPVLQELTKAAPITFELAIGGATLALLIGLPIGIVSAVRERTWLDYLGRSISILGLSIPNFWLGTLVLIFPALWFGWVPPTQYKPIWEAPLHNLEQFWLPSLVIGASASASLMRMTRSAMLEVLRQDYVRTARAKGLPERTVILSHALRNALVPVVTLFGFLTAGLLTGALVTESIFNLPGFGSLILRAIGQRDYPLIQGSVLIFGVIYTVVNILVDISYAMLNPRIRYA